MLLQEMIAMGFVLLAITAFFLFIGLPVTTSILYAQLRKNYEKRTGLNILLPRRLVYLFISLFAAFIIVSIIFKALVWMLDKTTDFSSS